MATLNEQAFENKCMDMIEKIVSISPKQNREGAIAVAEKMLLKAQEKKASKSVIDIYERVISELKIATDKEYEDLRKLIFSE